MKKQERRNLSTLPPLQPQSCDSPQPAVNRLYDEMARALAHERTRSAEKTRTIVNERRRHASVEALTLRMVAQLEQQVLDLRSAYFTNLTLRANAEKQ